jgi:hypothetical protein
MFTVEDGTGKVDSNSYCLVAYADAYFLDRNISTWTGTNTVKQGVLIQATDYIELRFSHLFKGEKKVAEQALSFPRISSEFDEMPVALLRACCEYALRAIPSLLLPDPKIDPTGKGLERVRKRVGPIETETRYQYQGAGTIATIIRPYPAADGLLKDLIYPSGGRVIRG